MMFDVHVVVFPVNTCQAIGHEAIVCSGGRYLPSCMIPKVIATVIRSRISIKSCVVEM